MYTEATSDNEMHERKATILQRLDYSFSSEDVPPQQYLDVIEDEEKKIGDNEESYASFLGKATTRDGTE